MGREIEKSKLFRTFLQITKGLRFARQARTLMDVGT
jgi:hypothetical protein